MLAETRANVLLAKQSQCKSCIITLLLIVVYDFSGTVATVRYPNPMHIPTVPTVI